MTADSAAPPPYSPAVTQARHPGGRAGFGTAPYTDDRPKPLVEIPGTGMPILGHQLGCFRHRGLGRHTWNSGRSRVRQRAFRRRLISELISSVRLCDRSGVVSEVPSLRWASVTIEAGCSQRASCAVGGFRRVDRRTGTAAGGCPAFAGVSQTNAAAGHGRVPGACSRIRMPGKDVVPAGVPWSAGALVDRAGLKGVAHWRGARVADAWKLHRERRTRHRRRYPAAHRTVSDRGTRPVRSRASRGDRLSWRFQ